MDKITDMSQTVELMSSEGYKERFIAEYAQLVIRVKRLEKALKHIEDDTTPDCFEPTCPFDLLMDQLYSMKDYKSVLENRALYENIDLPEVEI